MGRPRVMREGDLGRHEPLDPLPTLEEIAITGVSVTGLRDSPLDRLRQLLRSSRKEQRFAGGLDQRKMKTFYLIESARVDEILGGEP